MFAPLPGMVVALMAHQMIGVAWMIDRERGYSKGGKAFSLLMYSAFSLYLCCVEFSQVCSLMRWDWARCVLSASGASGECSLILCMHTAGRQTVQM